MDSDKRQSVRVPPDRLKDIAELAEEVAEEYGFGSALDLHRVLRSDGITWSYGYYDDAFDGMLEHESGKFHVYCNLNRVDNPTSVRARFTMAHELGHFYIDEHRNELAAGRTLGHGSKCEYESRNPVEQEADHFASSLLMPAKHFVHAARDHPVGLKAVLALANLFRTSITSTAIRYTALDIKPCIVVKWGINGYQWRWLSAEARLGRYWKTIDSTDQILHDSPTGRALSGEQSFGAAFFEAGTTASAWFPFVAPGSYKDVLLIEQAIPLGRFGTLTFIYPPDGQFPHFE